MNSRADWTLGKYFYTRHSRVGKLSDLLLADRRKAVSYTRDNGRVRCEVAEKQLRGSIRSCSMKDINSGGPV